MIRLLKSNPLECIARLGIVSLGERRSNLSCKSQCFIARSRSTACPSSTGRRALVMRPCSCCCTDCPSSSRMFEPLFSRLSGQFHLIAPDYPGFGHSDWPNAKEFAYTFDHIATVMDHFTQVLGLQSYTLYMQDYGGPVGFRLALAHPEPDSLLDCAERRRAQRRLGRDLEDPPRILGRPARI